MSETAKKVLAAVSRDVYTVPLLINGQEVQAENAFDVVSPATGRVVHKCGNVSEFEARLAVDAAATAFKSWKNTVPQQRRDIFLKAAEVLDKRKEELAQYMMDETGASRDWADFNLGVAKDFILDVAGRLITIEGSIPTTQDPEVGALILKEPFGVVLAIAPWNAPYILATRGVAFPIAAGNTVVLKGSELSPRCMFAVASIFKEAGLPDGVLNFVSAEQASAAAVTEALVANPDVKKLNFTGSTAVGRIIGRLAGEHLKPALLELGGKAPAIVWEDADLDLAAQQCALGAFLDGGQICMSTERIIVHRAVRADFEARFLAAAEAIFGGGSDAPVMIHDRAVGKNRALLADAVAKGATVLYGGAEGDAKADANGAGKVTRMRPVVVSGVKPDMDIYRTESFGPSVSLFEVDTEEEALRIANDTEYGLTSAVFTEDLRRGLRFAKGIETGACHINGMTVHDESAVPHGGAKASGFGRFNAAGLEEWVRTKSVTFRF